MKKRMDYEEKVNRMHERHLSLSTNLIRNEKNNSMYLNPTIDPNATRNNSTYTVIHEPSNKCSYISGFFTQSREDEKPMKMPSCKMSRGIFLAIVFFLLFCSIIIWFFISGDLDDEGYHIYAQNGTNSTGAQYMYKGMPGLEVSKMFIIISTILIVLIIILFVFLGSLIHYYRYPDLYINESHENPTPKNAFASIFSSHRNVKNNLYYLDLNIKKSKLNSGVKSENELVNTNVVINEPTSVGLTNGECNGISQ